MIIALVTTNWQWPPGAPAEIGRVGPGPPLAGEIFLFWPYKRAETAKFFYLTPKIDEKYQLSPPPGKFSAGALVHNTLVSVL